MGHYLTQPEEIDYILMAEKLGIEAETLFLKGGRTAMPNQTGEGFLRTPPDTVAPTYREYGVPR